MKNLFKLQQMLKPTHESNFNEENVSPSGASLIWTEHHSDPPSMATDVEEFMPKVNEVTMDNSSDDEPLYAHVLDPPEMFVKLSCFRSFFNDS